MRLSRPRRLLGVIAALAVVASIALAVPRIFRPTPAPPPATAVDRLLTLRAHRSTDARAYARYLPDTGSLASQLAEASRQATATPVPSWQRPYVSDEGTSSADVVVVWKADRRFPDWPAATLFKVRRLAGGRWVVEDAQPLDRGSIPRP